MPKGKKRQGSMKKKSGWRKNPNMQDVEDFLEEQRLIERIGGNVETPSEKLFEDTTAEPSTKLTLRQKQKLKALEPSKSFIALENTSKVQDPIVKRNHVRTPYERKHPAIKARIERNKQLGIIPHRELQSLNDQVAARKKVKLGKEEKFDFSKDIWAEVEPLKEPLLDNQWINTQVRVHHMKNMGDDKVKVPEITHVRRSRLKAIDAIPGTSYNPLKEDYEKLVTELVEKEEEVMKKNEKLNRALKPLYQKITKSESKRRRREEMRQGFPLNSDDENEKDDASEGEYTSLNPPVRNKKKDLVQRRKQKEHRKREADKSLEKQEMVKLKDLGMLKMYKKQINKGEEQVKKQQKTRKELVKQNKVQPRRLARKKFEEEDIQIEETPEALGNLRKMKPLGNILVDRFKSLQKRNIVATSVRRMPRKLRLKKIKKNSHKEQQEAPVKRKKRSNKKDVKFSIHD